LTYALAESRLRAFPTLAYAIDVEVFGEGETQKPASLIADNAD
jgi:hypothetical protein